VRWCRQLSHFVVSWSATSSTLYDNDSSVVTPITLFSDLLLVNDDLPYAYTRDLMRKNHMTRGRGQPTTYTCLLTHAQLRTWPSRLCGVKLRVHRSNLNALVMPATSNGKRNVLVWRPSVCLSRLFSNLNRARGAYSTCLTRGQHATRLAYISVRVLRG